MLERLLAELDARNLDNVTRTESYLELYAYTATHPPDLPWVLMAHLVSRNGGYLMSDVAESLRRDDGVFAKEALEELFLFLERANYLIFLDAWWHVIHHLLGRSAALRVPRVPRFVTECWPRYEARVRADGPLPDVEKSLVFDLVTNEQNFIERRVVHHPLFSRARAIVGFIEGIDREAPLVLPCTDQRIKVAGFAQLRRRISTGWRIFDEVLADREKRREIYDWARAHPHTGSRSVCGGKPTMALRDAWPVSRVNAMWDGIHAPPEADVW